MTDRKRRILHVVNNLNYGGMERVVAEIVRRTDPSRFEMHVLALGYLGHFGEGLDAHATLHLGEPMPRWSLVYPRSFADQIARIAPDVVHLHSGVWYKAGGAAALAGVPYQIYTDHGRPTPDHWLHRAIDRRASRKTNVVVCVSDRLGQQLARFVKYPSRIRVIPNGVDTDRYAPRADDGEFRRELAIAEDVFLVGSIGRLESVKAYAVLIRAFAKLRAECHAGPRPVLVLVGDGNERQFLERLASDLGLDGSIHFVGWRSDIESIARAFSVFAMSSQSEGTSVSLLEAMSSGLCPVVTDVGGNSAVLGPELAHRLVPPADPHRMARALSEALTNTTARSRDALTARSRVLQSYSLGAMVQRYERLYSGERDQMLGAP